MAYMGNLVRGDRVRVTFEAEVAGEHSRGACLCSLTANGGKVHEKYLRHEGVQVEKIEPPVEVFKPGDRLRRKNWGPVAFEITLGSDGYLQHFSSGRVEYYKYTLSTPLNSFTTAKYEKVAIE